ncbi:questin oxidase family protein [Streptomyces sp. NPDC051940]|uniref:questin oxidase family protein n=1 Tax=Streptomyces sp. NPDC051940 TaxID=3155675 RepID=UPI00343220A1
MDTTGVFDEALERLHTTGPEFEGWLTNHGPMAVEALARNGRAAAVHHWLDVYEDRLDEAPRPAQRITADTWREALGDAKRLGDWPVYFSERLAEQPWREVLAEWWPRLLPGLAGGATHVVIRTGHAVRSLLEAEEASGGAVPAPRLAELAQSLGYWGARYQELPARVRLTGAASPAAALAAVPRVPDQSGGIRPRLAQLTAAGTPGWVSSVSSPRAPSTPEEARAALTSLVAAATHRYATHAHGSPVMLVHAATAPNAVLRTLPALPRDLWVPSYTAAWSATAAVLAAYGPPSARPAPSVPASSSFDDLLTRAASHGDEHAIKLVDTALDVGDTAARAAGVQAITLIDPLL